MSSSKLVANEVPQGSVLGMFDVYANDMHDCCESSSPLLCAAEGSFISLEVPKFLF